MDLPLLKGQAISFARVEIDHDPGAKRSLEADRTLESVWFRKTTTKAERAHDLLKNANECVLAEMGQRTIADGKR